MYLGFRGGFAFLLVVATLALSGVAAGEGNESPLADAGLDQAVAANETVRLDATGSRDPDGSVTAYEWEIEGPNGTTQAPNCATCGTTSFRPERPGQYNVTVTVTDDEGANATDTLYVQVEASEGPSVVLEGPVAPIVSPLVSGGGATGTATYAANLSRGARPIDRVVWLVDGERKNRSSIDGSAPDAVQYEHLIENTSQRTLTARVVDVSGRSATDSLSVIPNDSTSTGGGSGGGSNDENWMQGEFAGRQISYRAPRFDTETGELVRQGNPTEEEYMNIAYARSSEEVKTTFGGDEDDDSDSDETSPNDDGSGGLDTNPVQNNVNPGSSTLGSGLSTVVGLP